MPSLKEVRNRIKSVSSTQQITKAMKMVAASKLRRAQDNIMKIRPYADKLRDILDNLSQGSEYVQNLAYAEQREVKSALIVAITSDRGLCGPFNTNIYKAALALAQEKYPQQLKDGKVTFLCVGKKALDFFKKRGYSFIDDHALVMSTINFEAIKVVAEAAMKGFTSGQYDSVDLVYNEFKNVATQIVRQESFLPLQLDVTEIQTSTSQTDYIFEPSVEEIISELVPKSLKIKFYRAVLESNASEHGARMTAMDKATDNAGEMLKDLKLSYNRSRQAAITKEILEIVAGASAL